MSAGLRVARHLHDVFVAVGIGVFKSAKNLLEGWPVTWHVHPAVLHDLVSMDDVNFTVGRGKGERERERERERRRRRRRRGRTKKTLQ